MAQPPANNETTPLMIGGLVYFSTGIGGVAALDAATGKVVWHVDSLGSTAAVNGTARDDDGGLVGGATRGISYWTDGREERIIALLSSRYLVALNPKTGERVRDFGEDGAVDLRKGQERGVTAFSWRTGPTVIVRGVVIVGSNVQDINNARSVSTKPTLPAMFAESM